MVENWILSGTHTFVHGVQSDSKVCGKLSETNFTL